MTEFRKYPKVANQQKADLESGTYTAQVKLDGANSGLFLTDIGGDIELVVHSRNLQLALFRQDGTVKDLNEHGAFAPFIVHISRVATPLVAFMLESGITHIYGEWLVPHTIKYPKWAYQKFYPFDCIIDGKFSSVLPYWGELEAFGFHPIDEWEVRLEAPVAESAVRAITLEAAGKFPDYRTEGIVLKRYDLDALGQLNRYGERHCYKDVLPEFREDHRVTFGGRSEGAVMGRLPEEELADSVPERSLEKVYQKVCDAKGGWENKHIPMLLGMVWQEFLEEWAASGLKAMKYPTLDTKVLKARLDARARHYALSRPLEV